MTIIFQLCLTALVALSFIMIVGVPRGLCNSAKLGSIQKVPLGWFCSVDWLSVFSWCIELSCSLTKTYKHSPEV